MTDPVLELATRARIVAEVEAYPGLHLRELARRLDVAVALVEYHAPILVEAGLVVERREDGYLRLFPATGAGARLTEDDRRRLALLRDRNALRVMLHLLGAGPTPHKDLAAALGLGKSALSFHLRKLERSGLARRADDGRFQATDRKGTLRLLVRHPPTPDVRDEFASLWRALWDA